LAAANAASYLPHPQGRGDRSENQTACGGDHQRYR
jgi:hypothetical protein